MGLKYWPKTTKRNFYIAARGSTFERIGPHNEEIISILVGSLLGNAHAEKRSQRTRIHFNKSSNNLEYVEWLHSKLVAGGYCHKKDLLEYRGMKNKMIKFNTFSFSSLNFLYDLFYDRLDPVKPISRKRMSRNYMFQLEDLFTPLAFAVWFMDDGGYYRDERLFGREGLTITPSVGFDYNVQIDIIREIIYNRYEINTKYVYRLYKSKELIMFPPEEIPKLNEVIGPFVLPSLQYKLKLPERKVRVLKRKRRSLFLDDDDEISDIGVNG
jgi:ubiquinol-cytochrome c reductase cytochrome b subunit